MAFVFVPVDEMSDFDAPMQPGAAIADYGTNIWIAPHYSGDANSGVLYDVISKQGVIIYRVQFPFGYALAGFGPGGDFYVLRIVGKTGFLERAKLR